MKVVLFCHSLASDWNHGNAHFLRGIVSELAARGHKVSVYEPRDAWSRLNLLAERGPSAINDYRKTYPGLRSTAYERGDLDIEGALRGADLVLVHEWNDHDLVAKIGEHRLRGSFRLFFHDTHHRSATSPSEMSSYDLRNYDGVLAFGQLIRDCYLEQGWAKRAWTWHEAADPRVFHPLTNEKEGDLVWIGNWGDDERTDELNHFLLEPVKELGLKAAVYGVRYPESAVKALADAGIEYRGFLANYEAPDVYSRYRVTVHIPRRPYVRALPGIPTIRMFEALACGIPLVSAPWSDCERLFKTGEDYLVARDGSEMKRQLARVLTDPELASGLSVSGLQTIRQRHTCAHRVDELMAILEGIESKEVSLR